MEKWIPKIALPILLESEWSVDGATVRVSLHRIRDNYANGNVKT